MMWISGVGALELLPAFIGSLGAFAVFGPFAARAQQRLSPLVRHRSANVAVDWSRAAIVVGVLATVVAVNVIARLLTASPIRPLVIRASLTMLIHPVSLSAGCSPKSIRQRRP